jgi:hypothetical protein
VAGTKKLASITVDHVAGGRTHHLLGRRRRRRR